MSDYNLSNAVLGVHNGHRKLCSRPENSIEKFLSSTNVFFPDICCIVTVPTILAQLLWILAFRFLTSYLSRKLRICEATCVNERTIRMIRDLLLADAPFRVHWPSSATPIPLQNKISTPSDLSITAVPVALTKQRSKNRD